MFLPMPRATLLMATPKNGKDDLKHLFIVLTHPNQDNDVLIVNLSSLYNRCDKTCTLDNQDHAFIKHTSYIAYKYSTIININKLAPLVVKQYPPMGVAIFEQICNGVLKSKYTPLKAKKFYSDYIQ